MPAPDDRRAALLAQLAYLIDEIEALKALADRVPEPYLVARPRPQDLSLKETYGLLAALDEQVHAPRLRQMTDDDPPVFDAVDERALADAGAWNDQPFPAILARVQAARRALLDAFETLPPDAWHRTAVFGDTRRDVYALAHHITQHDADLLRTVGYRLHEARLVGR